MVNDLTHPLSTKHMELNISTETFTSIEMALQDFHHFSELLLNQMQPKLTNRSKKWNRLQKQHLRAISEGLIRCEKGKRWIAKNIFLINSFVVFGMVLMFTLEKRFNQNLLARTLFGSLQATIQSSCLIISTGAL